MSSASPSAILASVSPVAGLGVSNVLPEAASVHWPLMKSWRGVAVNCSTAWSTLPLPDACADAIFAAGLVSHLPDTEAGLRELARVIRPGGKLVLFHPSGRAALAARHGHVLSPDDSLAEGPLRRATQASGWALTAYDDAPPCFFALADRR